MLNLTDFRDQAPKGVAQEAPGQANLPVFIGDFEGVARFNSRREGALQQGGGEDEGGAQEDVSRLQVPTQAQEQGYGQV